MGLPHVPVVPKLMRISAMKTPHLSWVALLIVAVHGLATPGRAEIRDEYLGLTRTISEGDWLQSRLEILGLRLSYPAYRVHIGLAAEERSRGTKGIAFTFWLSAPMSQHLSEAGRGETERVLAYHAQGVARQVGDLMREEFPELWPLLDLASDLTGIFLVPGDELEDPPREVAAWREDRLHWRDRR